MDFERLLLWYQENQRDLPFRKTEDPYHIWVSEIMLQQTQVDTVIPYFNKFIKIYPSVTDLAQTSEEVLLKVVEGLGYYRRFKHMLKAVQYIVNHHQGVFPSTYEDVLKLPGVGMYTAGAILSIAFHKPYSAVDGNVIRVLSRYFAIDDDMRQEKNKKIIQNLNQDLIEKTKPNMYTQALMELGAIICRPKQPKCSVCPLNQTCAAYQNNDQERYPVLSKLGAKTEKTYITFVIKDDKHYYLNKRTESLLEGMYEYPQIESESLYSALDVLEKQGVIIEPEQTPTVVKHVFTHQIWTMHVYHARLIGKSHPNWQKLTKEALLLKPMAVAHKKIKR